MRTKCFSHRELILLLLKRVSIALLFVVGVCHLSGCKPDNVTVKRKPDTASSIAQIEASQYDELLRVANPPAEHIRRAAMESVEQSELAEEISSNADLVISRFSILAKVDLGCDEDGIRWLSQYIDSKYEIWSPTTIDNLVDTLGSYFGECVRNRYGGQWYKVDGQIELRIDTSRSTYPFELIRNHIENGSSDSILGSYEQLSQALNSASRPGDLSN